MALEVEYITLGDAAKMLDVSSSTLRGWTDQMEKFNIHFLLRNNRNERIFEESDIVVFKFIRDQRGEHGRRAQIKDVGYMLLDRAESGELKLRTREDAPPPNTSNRTTDLLNQDDLKRLMESDRVAQLMTYIMEEAMKATKQEMVEEIKGDILELGGQLKGDISELKDDLKGEINVIKGDLKGEINVVKGELVGEISNYSDDVKAAIEEIEKRRAEKQQEFFNTIKERDQFREERDRKAREKWEQEQEALRKKEQEELIKQKEDLRRENEELRKQKEALEKQQQEQPEPEKPKSIWQKIIGR